VVGVSGEPTRTHQQDARWHRWMAAFDLALLAVTALLGLVLLRGVDGPPRLLAALAFACLVPGGALVTRLPFRDPD
jgi:predicted Na+-dependent transporter